MSARAGRMARLVELARRREDQARQQVARARQDQRRAEEQVEERRADLARTEIPADGFRFGHALGALGRDALQREQHQVAEATTVVTDQMATWQSAHQRLGTFERLDERLQEQLRVERLLRQQQETDDLAATRHGSHR